MPKPQTDEIYGRLKKIRKVHQPFQCGYHSFGSRRTFMPKFCLGWILVCKGYLWKMGMPPE